MLKDLIHQLEEAFDTLKRSITQKMGYDDPIRLDRYNGHAQGHTLWLSGRALRNPKVRTDENQNALENALDMFHRYETDEVPQVPIRLSVGEQTFETRTDQEGYYTFEQRLDEVPPAFDGIWHKATLEVLPSDLDPDHEIPDHTRRFTTHFQRPIAASRYCIVSDIDDTVIRTGASNLFQHAQTVLLNNPTSREMFPGMARLLRDLTHRHDTPTHPLFFLSSSPWNIHELFVEVFKAHQVPMGTFFLKDFGLDEDKFIKTGHGTHKAGHITTLLTRYPDLEFVLIGDSGQHDAEIYAQVIAAHPGRIKACYIRDVTQRTRDEAVQALAAEIETHGGTPFKLVQTTAEIRAHAQAIGLLD